MRIVILGDSIAAGLGVKGKCYGDLIKTYLKENYGDAEIINYAGSAMQLKESMNYLVEIIKLQPDLIIIAHGITEAIIRPNDSALKFMPIRWRKAGWMDRRPYYSKSLRKRIVQRIESEIRWRTKNLLIKLSGGITWGDKIEFEENLRNILNQIISNSKTKVILMSHTSINDKYFPGSLDSLNEYKNITKSVCSSFNSNQVHFCDVSNVCYKWDDYLDDHFHPNYLGHKKIAKSIIDKVESNIIKSEIAL